jgi:hypothetical protein
MPWLTDREAGADLWLGRLEPVAEDVLREDQPADAEPFDPRDLPEVAIGPAETWRLTEAYPPPAMPAQLRALVEDDDFYVVRLRFSFRPTKGEVEVMWARFAVELLGAGEIRAEAIHPESIEDEVAGTRRFTLAPSLKFAEVEAKPGEIEFGFEYTSLEPLVFGATEPANFPSWDFQPTKGHELYGSRRMHLLVRADRGTPSGRARLHLAADVRAKRFLLRATTKRDLEPLDVVLWGSGY